MATSTTRPSTLEDFYTQPKEYALDPAISNYWTPDRLMADYARKPFTPAKMDVQDRYGLPSSPSSGVQPVSPFTADEIAYLRKQKSVSDLYFRNKQNPLIPYVNDTAWADYDVVGLKKHLHPLSIITRGLYDPDTLSSGLNTAYTGSDTSDLKLGYLTPVTHRQSHANGGQIQGYAPGGAIGGNFGDPSPAPFAGVPSAFSGVQAPTPTSSSRSRSSGLSTPATRSSSMGQNNHREVDTYVAPQYMTDEEENDHPDTTATNTPTFYTAPTVDAAPSSLLQPNNNRVVTAPPATETAGTPATQAELDDIEENNHPEWNNQPSPSNERPVPEGQRGAYNVGTEGAFGNKADVGYEGVDPNETYRTGTKPGEYKYYNYYANGPYQGMFFADGGMAEIPDDMGEMGMPPDMPQGLPDGFAAQLQHALQALTSQNQESGDSGGSGGRYLKGPGDGMSDEIPAAIDGQAPAALSDGEFVISADVVSGLGNGSSDAGAKVLHKLMDRVRLARTGNVEQAKKVNPEKLLPKIRG